MYPFFSPLERTASAAAALGEPAERHSFSCPLLSLLFERSDTSGWRLAPMKREERRGVTDAPLALRGPLPWRPSPSFY
jgi:hypothetical protein